jgi:hypothetical protein
MRRPKACRPWRLPLMAMTTGRRAGILFNAPFLAATVAPNRERALRGSCLDHVLVYVQNRGSLGSVFRSDFRTGRELAAIGAFWIAEHVSVDVRITRQRQLMRPNRSVQRSRIRVMRCCQVSTPAYSRTFNASATVLRAQPAGSAKSGPPVERVVRRLWGQTELPLDVLCPGVPGRLIRCARPRASCQRRAPLCVRTVL